MNRNEAEDPLKENQRDQRITITGRITPVETKDWHERLMCEHGKPLSQVDLVSHMQRRLRNFAKHAAD